MSTERHVIHPPVIHHMHDGSVIITQDEEHTFTGDAWLEPHLWNRAVLLDGEIVEPTRAITAAVEPTTGGDDRG